QEQVVDTDIAVRNALDKRSDLRVAKNVIERSDIDIRYLRNQILPDVNANATYIATGVGGVQLSPIDPFAVASLNRSVVAQRGYGSVLGDVFQNAYPDWTVGVSISYPLGTNTAHTNLARAKLQYQQDQITVKNLEMQVATQVRDFARQVE